MSPHLSIDEIRSWPKAELHSHLDGAMRPGTMVELAKNQGKLGMLPADSINTDSLLFSHTTTSQELLRAHEDIGFTAEQTRRCAAQAFLQAFAPLEERQERARHAADQIGISV